MNVVLIRQQGPYLNEFKLVPWSPLSSDPVANRLREAIFSTLDCLQGALTHSDLGWENRGNPLPSKVIF